MTVKLTKAQRKNLYLWCLEEGISIQYGRLSLCDLTNFHYSDVYNNRRYQVHCEDPKYPWSRVYDRAGPAVEKFLEIKRKVKRIR